LNVKDLKLEFGHGLTPPPFYIGAVGRRMVEFAATEGDGLLVTACSSVASVKEVVQWALSAVKHANREPSNFEIAVLAILSVSKDPTEAKNATRKWVKTLTAQPYEPSTQLVDHRLVDELTIAGTPEDCIVRMRQYEATGATNLVLVPMSADPIGELEMLRART
jgi:alkanesulfonate monooxygenase SsuD/methylene tetrahydromethanopterin reductase-like flavin-dependent oxidoreductase (luciferase family)